MKELGAYLVDFKKSSTNFIIWGGSNKLKLRFFKILRDFKRSGPRHQWSGHPVKVLDYVGDHGIHYLFKQGKHVFFFPSLLFVT